MLRVLEIGCNCSGVSLVANIRFGLSWILSNPKNFSISFLNS